ncbi:POLG alternative reading frame-like [Symphalangus syndactylus]|uniref:POLG alternative reading frame-like n=1 Tax=Symphalangus syndactylus TaxID=9590 RepID=UPI003007A01E
MASTRPQTGFSSLKTLDFKEFHVGARDPAVRRREPQLFDRSVRRPSQPARSAGDSRLHLGAQSPRPRPARPEPARRRAAASAAAAAAGAGAGAGATAAQKRPAAENSSERDAEITCAEATLTAEGGAARWKRARGEVGGGRAAKGVAPLRGPLRGRSPTAGSTQASPELGLKTERMSE